MNNSERRQLTLAIPATVYLSYHKTEDEETYVTVFSNPESAFIHARNTWREVYKDITETYESDEVDNWLSEGIIYVDPRYLQDKVPFCNYFTEIAYDQVWVDVETVYD